ncbi:peptide chain release factor H [Flavobacterium reichenbachii]|uniref:Peptide chain release factor H n=1 Tax=Flavobacterium reichenbachii TaxID=362418 RepID=A0A085ZJ17_9FLAO|nr:peptide chain release factor H [Flavobacterium reichenbachii]KFF04431.1 peptide chain release factor H [Flavobacterium reichenbachii]OXB12576.1 peptide chain release factor H [Flavobacterium reichenbachii]
MEKIIQITAGRGPAECTWVVAQVLKKVLDEAQEQGLEATLLQREVGQENGTVETATIGIKGNNAEKFTNSWIGTIQWIGQSQFRKMNKRKNWFIGVFEIESQKGFSVSEKDIQYQAMRSSGAGGQHVNKVSSAVRATHIPTGIAVVSMDSRSQHQNKKLATERLLKKIEDEKLVQLKNHVGKQWENQLNIERGNPVRVFTGSDFKKNKVEKSYKETRQKLKNDLRNENN